MRNVILIIGILSLLGCDSKEKKQSEPQIGNSIISNNEFSQSDLGKVYIVKNRKSEPNFGKYLLLISTESQETYAFNSFDLVNNQPIGKLVVSYSKKLPYEQVNLDDDLIKKAKKACELRMVKEGEDLKSQINSKKSQSNSLKEKYGIDKSYALNRFGNVKGSNYKYGIWIDPNNKEFAIQIYSEKEILKQEKLKWIEDPLWQISKEDQKNIIGILDKLMAELENK